MKNYKRHFSVLLAAVMCVCCVSALVSCGSDKSYVYGNSFGGTEVSDGHLGDTEFPGSSGTSEESSGSSAEQSITSDRKIVKTVDLSLESYDYAAAAGAVTAEAEAVGGYVESCEENGVSVLSSSRVSRHGSYTVRIPAERLEEYIAAISGGDVNVLSRSETVEDITDRYYDTESRISSLKTQLERLEQLLAEASDVPTMLDIESRMSEVRYELESYQSAMQRYDKQVSYSTVNISVTEVKAYSEQSEDSFVTRLKKAFSSSWSDFAEGLGNVAVGFVYVFPVLLVLGIIAVIVVLVIRGACRRSRKKHPLPRNGAASSDGEARHSEPEMPEQKEQGSDDR